MNAADGRVRLDGAIFDVTDRRLGELERLKLAAIVESSDDAITSADLDGIVTSWNKGAEQMFGYTAEEMIGQSGSVLVPEGETTDSSARIAAVVEFGEGRFEVTRRRKDGTLIEIAVTMSAVRNRAGEVVGVASIAQDITDRRRLEQEREEFTRELEVRNERLLELDHLKDEFVALVSHELRTPLTSIRGYLELVLDGEAGEVTDEQRQFLGVVERNANRLLDLVGDLLFLAQIEAGKLSLEFGAVDLAAVAAESVETARPLAEEKEITLTLATSPLAAPRRRQGAARAAPRQPRLERGQVHAPGRPGGRARELVTRKRDSRSARHRHGHPRRRAGARVRALLPDLARDRAGDSGNGARPGHLQRDRARPRRTDHPREQRGRRRDLPRHDPDPRSAAGRARTRGDRLVSERPLVLVADDDPDILSLVTLRLERDGYEVIGAPDGERAVEEALERTPDLALIDVSMPKLDGYEVTERLRQHEPTKRDSDHLAHRARPGFRRCARDRGRCRRLREEAVLDRRPANAGSGGPGPVAVPEPAHGLDQGFLRPRLRELMAQVADVELRAGTRAAERVAPDELEELLVGEHLVRMADEDGEELELERRQRDLVPADGRPRAG